MPKILGIDEAGRGPVIGPMVMAAVMMEEKDLGYLDELGVKDSKLLSEIQREAMFDKILELDHKIIVVSPQEIDATLASEESNLNWLEADKACELINALKPDKAIIDCPSNNIEKYTEYIKKKLKVEVELLVEHKADLNHKIAGAGSILAKVTRDREIQKLQKTTKDSIGSGYPSDPYTQAFLKKNYLKHKSMFRTSWQSYKKVVDAKKQKSLGEF